MTKQEYRKYLKSDHWKNKKQEFYSSKHFTGHCLVCGNTKSKLEIHHKNYKRLWNERLSDLCALCPACHKNVHRIIKDSNGRFGTRTAVRHLKQLVNNWSLLTDEKEVYPDKKWSKEQKKFLKVLKPSKQKRFYKQVKMANELQMENLRCLTQKELRERIKRKRQERTV